MSTNDSARIEAALRLLPARRDQIDADELDLIEQARAAGWTWVRLAEVFGFSGRQSAQDHHKRLSASVEAKGRGPVRPPGEILKAALDCLGMSQAELSRRTGLSTKHVNQVAQGVATLSIETAIKVEEATGIPAMLWNTLEAAYRDALARRPAGGESE
jgi:plasmid maintenance system antidote protein VapI